MGTYLKYHIFFFLIVEATGRNYFLEEKAALLAGDMLWDARKSALTQCPTEMSRPVTFEAGITHWYIANLIFML